MNLEYIILVVIGSLLIIGLNITENWWQYKILIKEEKLYKKVPSWQGTQKAYIWYIIWSIVLWFDLICFLIVAILLNSMEYLFVAFIITVPPFIILYQIITHC